MSIRITGNGYVVIGKWRKQLAGLDESFRRDVAASMADETIGLVADGFRGETDPYGKPWAPKQLDDGRKVLSGPTGRLKKFARKEISGSGFWVGPVVDYGQYHQNAKPPRKRRAMVPFRRKLPRRWESAFASAFRDAMDTRFR